MWTRRVLLATMVAACAMTLPRLVPASWTGGDSGASVAISSIR